MNIKLKLKYANIVIALLLMMGGGIFLPVVHTIQETNDLSPTEDLFPNSSAFEDHAAISLSGDTALADFFSGNVSMDGLSWETAYVFENYSIDMYDERETCISIQDTTKYLIIRNVTLRSYAFGGTAGIFLNNCRNICIDNISTITPIYGLKFVDTTNVLVSNSTLDAYAYGIDVLRGGDYLILKTPCTKMSIYILGF